MTTTQEEIDVVVPQVQITEADELKMKRRANDLEAASAPFLEIKTPAEYEAAGVFLTSVVKAMEQEINGTFGPIEQRQKKVLDAAKEAMRETVRQRDIRLAPVKVIEGKVKVAIADYVRRAEAARKELADRICAREAERVKALAEADATGDHAAARALELIPSTAPPAPLPKVEGVSVRKRSDYELLDVGALKPGFVKPDLGKLRTAVNALGRDAVTSVSRPGGPPAIRVFEVSDVAAKPT